MFWIRFSTDYLTFLKLLNFYFFCSKFDQCVPPINVCKKSIEPKNSLEGKYLSERSACRLGSRKDMWKREQKTEKNWRNLKTFFVVELYQNDSHKMAHKSLPTRAFFQEFLRFSISEMKTILDTKGSEIIRGFL